MSHYIVTIITKIEPTLNGIGSASSPQPVIQSLSASSLGLYSHFTLNCSSGASAATEVTWTKDSQPLTIDNRVYSTFQILMEGTRSSYDNLLVVAISDVNEHSGQYDCTIRNSFGSDTQSATFLGIYFPTERRNKTLLAIIIIVIYYRNSGF